MESILPNRPSVMSVIKTISFVILVTISFSVTMYLFIQFSDKIIEKVFFGCLAFAVEGSKIFALVSGMSMFTLKKYGSFAVRITIYGFLAILSILASYGFTLSSIQGTQDIVATSEYTNTALKDRIAEIDKQAAILEKRQADMPSDFVTASNQITKQLNQLASERADLVRQIVATPVKKEVAKSVFQLIAESLGMTSKRFEFLLLILLSIMVETCVVFTSPKAVHEFTAGKREPPQEPSQPITVSPIPAAAPVAQTIEASVVDSMRLQSKIELHRPPEKPTERIEMVEPEPPKQIEAPSAVVPTVVVSAVPTVLPSMVAEEALKQIAKKPQPMVANQMRFGGKTAADKMKFEKFLKALFNENTSYLNDVKTAATTAGIEEAVAMFYLKRMMETKSSKGYPLVEFRNKNYYPYYSQDIILRVMTQLIGK
jgi:hypothetical protein